MAYSDKVINHFETPQNVGSFDKNASDIGTGLVGAPACGDVMKLQIKVEDNKIVDTKFKLLVAVVLLLQAVLLQSGLKVKRLDEAMEVEIQSL